MRLSKRTRLFAVGLSALALLAAACDSTDPEDPGSTNGNAGDEPGDTMDDVTGTVPIAGSSTVEPISTLVGEDFRQVVPNANVAIEITGTSTGFAEHFCKGLTAVSNASRPIRAEEIQQCADVGVTNILELKVGIDGMSVVTSPDNDLGITCLSTSEIYALVGPESGTNSGASAVVNWGDADALADEIGDRANESFAELGGDDAQLQATGPGTESGTYDSFWELAIEGIGDDRGVAWDTDGDGVDDKAGYFRDDWQGNNLDTATQTAVIGNKYSFGWFGFAFYVGIQDQLTAFDIQDENGDCVTPTPETIASNEYPLSRDLFIYVDLDKLDNPDYGDALEAYVDYYLSDAGFDLVAEAGYVNLADDAWAETVALWEAKAPAITTQGS